jgi:pimeloyl-ACP methyl ester carboxylesterase
MVQTLTSSVIGSDPVVYDWPNIKAPTLAFGGAEDVLPGSVKLFQDRMKVLADTIPNGNGKLHLISGLGHVPHLEDAGKTLPPLVAFLKDGVKMPSR